MARCERNEVRVRRCRVNVPSALMSLTLFVAYIALPLHLVYVMSPIAFNGRVASRTRHAKCIPANSNARHRASYGRCFTSPSHPWQYSYAGRRQHLAISFGVCGREILYCVLHTYHFCGNMVSALRAKTSSQQRTRQNHAPAQARSCTKITSGTTPSTSTFESSLSPSDRPHG